jgi:hypothetical protein
MTVLEAALEALRHYHQPAQKDDSSSAPSPDCEKSEISEKRSVELVEVACTCAKWPFPHLHGLEDRRRAIEAWNGDSPLKLGWIQ